MTGRVFSSDMLVEAIARILREDGWTCEYHAPASSRGECGQCDRAHDATARRIAAMAIPTKPLALPTMKPMTQEPDETVEAVILKERWFSEGSGYTFGQRGSGGWYVIADHTWHQRIVDIDGFDGWWPLDIRSVIDG